MFKTGLGRVLTCHVPFALVVLLVTQTYGYLSSANTYVLPELAWVLWATFLFLHGSFLRWMPLYSLSFYRTKGVAR